MSNGSAWTPALRLSEESAASKWCRLKRTRSPHTISPTSSCATVAQDDVGEMVWGLLVLFSRHHFDAALSSDNRKAGVQAEPFDIYTSVSWIDKSNVQYFLDANKLPKVMFGDPGTAFFKEWKKLRDKGADFKACTQPNPPGIGGTGFRMALSLYNGKQFKPGVLKNNTYFYKVGMFITDKNFDEGWKLLKDKPDDYLLSEVMPQAKVDALFQ